MRRLLIVAELTLSVVLLVGCGLIVRSLAGLYANVDGFMPRIDARDRIGRRSRLCHRASEMAGRLERARSIPRRIRRVVVTAASPRRADTVVHGRRTAGKRSEIGRPRRRHLISSEYFRAMGIPLVKGRVHEADTYTSPPVVIVSETLARQQFPDEDRRAPHPHQRAFGDDMLRHRRSSRERLAGDRRRGSGHPSGQPRRAAGGDDVPAMRADLRHVPHGKDADRSRCPLLLSRLPRSCGRSTRRWSGGRFGRCIR